MVLTIGQLAESAAVNIQTVRYYERVGLLARPSRAKNGYRECDHATVRRQGVARSPHFRSVGLRGR